MHVGLPSRVRWAGAREGWRGVFLGFWGCGHPSGLHRYAIQTKTVK
ncbi:hypothetical protein Salmuc_04984 [Salipiger mucosus DSM 16094]|uniref:Uncharacterized protein n=1 Tax=Salipiger mucosus DSM 16094 TaxID=1123237 RepID=S9R1E7_9RHOB|nr:hypothetical protein Salmuc_04984 [Salipiger mucosus DSM 16094]